VGKGKQRQAEGWVNSNSVMTCDIFAASVAVASIAESVAMQQAMDHQVVGLSSRCCWQ